MNDDEQQTDGGRQPANNPSPGVREANTAAPSPLTDELLDQIAARISAAPARGGRSVAEVVRRLMPPIAAARRRAAPWEHIAQSLTEHGIAATADGVRMAYRRASAARKTPLQSLAPIRTAQPPSSVPPPPPAESPRAAVKRGGGTPSLALRPK